MVDVVSSVHLNDMLDTFFTPLGVDAMMFPLFRSKRFQQGKVCLAEHAEQHKRFSRIPLFVMAGDRPNVLIESLDRCAGCSQNLPHSPAPYDFRVGQMRENLGEIDLAKIMRIADQALYVAKHRGRDRVARTEVAADSLAA